MIGIHKIVCCFYMRTFQIIYIFQDKLKKQYILLIYEYHYYKLFVMCTFKRCIFLFKRALSCKLK